MVNGVVAVVGRVDKIPQQSGDGAFVAIGGCTGQGFKINGGASHIDIEIRKARAGHDRARRALVIIGETLAPGKLRARGAVVNAGQGMRTARILIAAKLVIGKVAPLVDDHRIIPLVGAGGVVGDYERGAGVAVERAGGLPAALPIDSDAAVHGRRTVAKTIVPIFPCPVEAVGNVKDWCFQRVDRISGHVKIDCAAFRVDCTRVETVKFLLAGLFDARDPVWPIPHFGTDARVEFQFIVEKTIVVTEAKLELAVRIGNRVTIGVVGESIFLTHLDQDVVHRNRAAAHIIVARWIGRRLAIAPRQNASYIKAARRRVRAPSVRRNHRA